MTGPEKLELFSNVVLLYLYLREGSMNVGSDSHLFVIDVEIKTKRCLGNNVYSTTKKVLTDAEEHIAHELGNTYFEYGLGPEGVYRNVYENSDADRMISIHRVKGGHEVQGGIPGSGK